MKHILRGKRVLTYCYDGLLNRRMVPVSYTHLDVYKIQTEECQFFNVFSINTIFIDFYVCNSLMPSVCVSEF